jgi:hypothetical protein
MLKRNDAWTGRQNASPPARPLLFSLLALICAGLVGCPLGFDVAENGGIGGTGISQGPITGFGSIFVNGVEWETDAADIRIDDVPSIPESLRLGMVVRVEGTIGADGLRGRAERVVFDDDVEGPIEDVPEETVPGVEKRFSVLGHTVIVVVDFTTFDGTASFAELEAEDMVEVSGLIDAEGRIHATRVEGHDAFDPGSSLAELKGDASAWVQGDTSAGVFAIGGVMIRYDADTDFVGLVRGDLVGAPYVEVEGVLESTREIHADRVELEDEGFEAAEGKAIELTGFVSDFISIEDFRVFGLPVDARTAEIDEDLLLADGVLVEIQGTLLGGVLIAEEIEAVDDDHDHEARIRASASNLDYDARTLKILGVSVRTDGKTMLKDDLLHLPRFRFDEIVEGDWLDIKGREVEGMPSTVLASRIERRPPQADVELRGRVGFHDLMQQEIQILGIDLPPVDLSGGTLFFDGSGVEIDVSAFMAVLDGGSEIVVTARDRDAADKRSMGEIDELELEIELSTGSDD